MSGHSCICQQIQTANANLHFSANANKQDSIENWEATAGGRLVSRHIGTSLQVVEMSVHQHLDKPCTPSSMLGREYILQCAVSSDVVLRMMAPYTKFNVGVNTFYSWRCITNDGLRHSRGLSNTIMVMVLTGSIAHLLSHFTSLSTISSTRCCRYVPREHKAEWNNVSEHLMHCLNISWTSGC